MTIVLSERAPACRTIPVSLEFGRANASPMKIGIHLIAKRLMTDGQAAQRSMIHESRTMMTKRFHHCGGKASI